MQGVAPVSLSGPYIPWPRSACDGGDRSRLTCRIGTALCFFSLLFQTESRTEGPRRSVRTVSTASAEYTVYCIHTSKLSYAGYRHGGEWLEACGPEDRKRPGGSWPLMLVLCMPEKRPRTSLRMPDMHPDVRVNVWDAPCLHHWARHMAKTCQQVT